MTNKNHNDMENLSIREKSKIKLEEDQKRVKEKTQPLVDATKKAVFIASSKQLAKKSNIPKHIFCKNIERKYGKTAAAQAFKQW